MANHIRSKLTVDGSPEQIEEVFAFLKSTEDEERLIDLENITPMPKWVYGSSPDVRGISQRDEEKYGKENTVINWRYANWGTKWNAYETSRKGNVLRFETANGSPVQLIEKLAWLFPDVTLTHFFYDSSNPQTEYTYTFKDTDVKESVKAFEYDQDTGEWIEIGGEE